MLEILEKQENFTDTDRCIASYLLQADVPVLHCTSTELAEQCHVSQSAVIRLVKKTGCEGYRDFLLCLQREKTERQRTETISLEQPFHSSLKAAEAEKAVHDVYTELLRRIEHSLDLQKVQRLYNRMKQAHMIDLYGAGISALYARQLAFDLSGTGMNCRFMEGDNVRYICSRKDPVSAEAVIFSFTGRNEMLNGIARELKRYGFHVTAIVGRDSTPLQQIADDSIVFAPEYYDVLDNLSFEFSVSYVNHILYAMSISDCTKSSHSQDV